MIIQSISSKISNISNILSWPFNKYRTSISFLIFYFEKQFNINNNNNCKLLLFHSTSLYKKSWLHRITYSQYFILYELQQNFLYKRILNINDYLNQYDLHINKYQKNQFV